MNRTLSHMRAHDTGCITVYNTTLAHAKRMGWPSDYGRELSPGGDMQDITRKRNSGMNSSLSDELKKSGFGYFKVTDLYNENGVANRESSYFVVDRMDTGKLRDWLFSMGKKYTQWSILFAPAGTSAMKPVSGAVYKTTRADDPDDIGKETPAGKLRVLEPAHKFGNSEGATFIGSRPFTFTESNKEKLTMTYGTDRTGMKADFKKSGMKKPECAGKRPALREGTGNFTASDGPFPVVAFIDDDDSLTDSERYADYEEEGDFASSLINSLSDSLSLYNLSVESGYYDGIQVVAVFKDYCDSDKGSDWLPWAIDAYNGYQGNDASVALSNLENFNSDIDRIAGDETVENGLHQQVIDENSLSDDTKKKLCDYCEKAVERLEKKDEESINGLFNKLTEEGWIKLNIDGHFDNGEAVYSRISESGSDDWTKQPVFDSEDERDTIFTFSYWKDLVAAQLKDGLIEKEDVENGELAYARDLMDWGKQTGAAIGFTMYDSLADYAESKASDIYYADRSYRVSSHADFNMNPLSDQTVSNGGKTITLRGTLEFNEGDCTAGNLSDALENLEGDISVKGFRTSVRQDKARGSEDGNSIPCVITLEEKPSLVAKRYR